MPELIKREQGVYQIDTTAIKKIEMDYILQAIAAQKTYTIKIPGLRCGKTMRLESRYVVLRDKETGHYLCVGKLNGEIVTYMDDIRGAYIFDMEDETVRKIAEKYLAAEWMVEYVKLPPPTWPLRRITGD